MVKLLKVIRLTDLKRGDLFAPTALKCMTTRTYWPRVNENTTYQVTNVSHFKSWRDPEEPFDWVSVKYCDPEESKEQIAFCNSFSLSHDGCEQNLGYPFLFLRMSQK